MIDLSVIISFHKGEHYLKDCMDSLKEQTIAGCPWYEILLVYDIANGEGKIQPWIEEYMNILPIKYIEQKDPSGTAAARNEGLRHAKGNYIYFLDSDDYLMPETLDLLLNKAKKTSSQMVYGLTEKTWFKRISFMQYYNQEESKQKEFFGEWQNPYNYFFRSEVSILNVLFERKLLEEKGIHSNESLEFYSDFSFLTAALSFTNRAVFEERAVYIKRNHNDEINLPSLSQRKSSERINQYLSAYEDSIRFAAHNNELTKHLQKMLCSHVIRSFTDRMHSFTRKPVWTEVQFHMVAEPLSKIDGSIFKEYGFLGKNLLKAAARGRGKAVMRIGNLMVIKRKKKGLFGNHIQRARALDRYLFRRLPRKDNWIVFESFLGKNFSDSCKYIYLYLHEHYQERYKFIWVMDNKETIIPGNPVIVKRFGFRYFYYYARAKYWVNNMRQPVWMEKRSGNVFLETWHGTPLKKLVFDMEDVHSASPSYKSDFYGQSRKWDWLLSDNPFSTEVFQSAFLFEKDKILEYGYPRNDIMHWKERDKIAENLRMKLGIPLESKTILYAPTWRDDDYYEPGKYKFKLELDLHRLKEELGNGYAVLLRTHYFIADQLDITGLEGFAYNLSHYDDISELYLISDICITDYSSVFFDYANLRRPILFFTYDLDKYRDVLRGFYIDIETDVPGPLLYTNDDVIKAIQNIDKVEEEFSERYEAFYQRFCSLDDGMASKRVVEKVFLGSDVEMKTYSKS